MHKLSNYIPIVLQNYSGAYLFLQSGTGCLLVFSGIISVEWLLRAVFGGGNPAIGVISRVHGVGEGFWQLLSDYFREKKGYLHELLSISLHWRIGTKSRKSATQDQPRLAFWVFYRYFYIYSSLFIT